MPESYRDAALRHYGDANHLAGNGRLDSAGYLIGYAVECAIKSSIIATRPTANTPHVHLPILIERAKKALQGRRKQSMFTLIEQDSFMQGWTIDARYCANGLISHEEYERWRSDATRALAAADLRRRAK